MCFEHFIIRDLQHNSRVTALLFRTRYVYGRLLFMLSMLVDM